MDLLHVALLKPEIHPNTGNIARLCAANRLPLHLVGKLGFRIDERSVRRAGLDYWPHVDLHREKDLEELKAALGGSRFFYFSVRAERSYLEAQYRRGNCLVFGSESKGLPEELLRANSEHALRIPMRSTNVRSLNLATAVAVAVYEALRQISIADWKTLCRSCNRQSAIVTLLLPAGPSFPVILVIHSVAGDLAKDPMASRNSVVSQNPSQLVHDFLAGPEAAAIII